MVQGIIIWTALASIVTGLMFAWDKLAAVRGGRRIPEKSLLLIVLLISGSVFWFGEGQGLESLH